MRRGFSLLEVMFAVALFGAVVTFILSAQGGLIASNKRAANMSQAVELARCRMSELEEKQLKLGYPGDRREGHEHDLLRRPGGRGLQLRLAGRARQAAGDDSPRGRRRAALAPGRRPRPRRRHGLHVELPTSLAELRGQRAPEPRRRRRARISTAACRASGSRLQQTLSGGAGAQGLLSMVFSIVYPSLKPVLESAIRRITVVVKLEGGRDRPRLRRSPST